jgi:DNA-binding HxlR family transcriptional regulator
MSIICRSDSVHDKHRAILRSLLFGDKTYYDLLIKEEIASNKTILKTLEKMEDEEILIKGEPVGPRGKINYSLTQHGLVLALKAFGNLEADKLDIIADAHKDKLELFRIWPLLEEKGFTSEIKEKFSDSLLNCTLTITKNVEPSDSCFLFTLFDHYRIYNKRDKLEELLDIIKSSDELRSRLRKELEENIKRTRILLNHYEDLYKYIDY